MIIYSNNKINCTFTDKDGIIMGEFGFVTADDVYHVTVYATDKEGRFKILSMKNIHLKSCKFPS